MKKSFDTGTLIVIIITFLLFVIALFTSGFTHDLLLESGVFLVSVKLIMMAYRTSLYYNNISVDLKKILQRLESNAGHESFDRK
ncbi:MAG: hypothetical protein MUE74_07425 [Bacteroidales bacterium]|jgi:hypothetical protein|nr:hypothetical protein [Bacteroidales bacterium]